MNNTIIKNISTNSSSILNEIVANTSQNATTVISQIDPYWFYSASAQCAAAIVGLMGAFITTKILNQQLYIKQLKTEIAEYDTKRGYIYNEITETKKRLEELDKDKDIKELKKIDKDFDPSNLPTYIIAHRLEMGEGAEVIKSKLEKYRKYIEGIKTKNGELLFYQNHLEYKKNQMESNKDSFKLTFHLGSLLLFSMLGVFLPLLMLLLDYNIMIRFMFWIFLLILLGWLTIIFTLYFEIWNLRD